MKKEYRSFGLKRANPKYKKNLESQVRFPLRLKNGVVIQLLSKKYVKELFQLVDGNRKHLRKWLPWVDATKTAADTEKFVEMALKQMAAKNGYHVAILYEEKIVGVVGFHEIDTNHKKASLGYWLSKKLQGNGIMTSVVESMVDHVFQYDGVNRVEIRCAMGNEKSRAIPERLGFKNEGMLRSVEWLYDHFEDHVVYGMLAKDWKIRSGTKKSIGEQ